MNALIRFYALPALVCFAILTQAEDAPPAWLSRYRSALAEVDEHYREQHGRLKQMYQSHLQSLQRAAQAEGDLETLIVLKNEETAIEESGLPGDFDPVGGLKEARRVFSERHGRLTHKRDAQKYDLHKTFVETGTQKLQSLTSDEEQAFSETLLAEIETASEQMKALSPDPTPQPTPTPIPERLGENVLPDGNVDDAEEKAWRISNPGKRNKTGFYQEPNSGRNKVFRFEQHENRGVGLNRHIRLKPDTTYRITYRARMLRHWKDGIELRGKGHYRMGFRIPAHIFNAMPLIDQQQHRRNVGFTREPPPDREWRQYREKLTAHPKQTVFYISVSPGEGDFLIDDIRIQPILPPK